MRSVVGRFLEHSRVYYFENGGQPEALIGSPDRVEVLCYVRDSALRSHLRDVVLESLLTDTDRAMELKTDGAYCSVRPGHDVKLVNA